MNRIDKVFKELQSKEEKALIAYISCGDPSLDFTEELVPLLADSGADLIELGIPYSDPVADGPTIQRASGRALAGGVTLEKILSMAKRLRKRTQVPLIMMTYYNPVYVAGLDSFVEKAALAGVDGLIIPDLPVEEAHTLKMAADKKNVHLIFMAAPTSTPERIARIAELSRGFVYCVSVAGVTGARDTTSYGLEGFLDKIRQHTELPLCVGFGISGPGTAREAVKHADGVIVGSSLIERIEQALQGENMQGEGCEPLKAAGPVEAMNSAAQFIRDIKAAIKK